MRLAGSGVSHSINTSFVERHHETDRGRNARKARKTYRFSKDWRVHEAMTFFAKYSYNFCWVVRTLRQKDAEGEPLIRRSPSTVGLCRFAVPGPALLSGPGA